MFRIILYILVGILIVGAGMLIYLTKDLSKYRKMVINDVDLTKIEDGVYEGEFSGGRWKNKLEVMIQDHRIDDIKLIKASSTAGMDDIGEKIFQKVEEKQSLEVDAVSGATVHTKAVLKSIENALSEDQQN
ncbi:MAG TPA: FMN-binding protein [Atribacterota bacterium]|nr:FMN-binding protein [Atribacterota bacterium]